MPLMESNAASVWSFIEGKVGMWMLKSPPDLPMFCLMALALTQAQKLVIQLPGMLDIFGGLAGYGSLPVGL